MIPKKLSLNGFLSYQKPVELDFSSFDVACISGANGAGKSSLLDAITWVIFGKARHRDDNLLINSHADTAEVILEFEYEGDQYRIQRSKTRDKTVRLEFQIMDETWQSITESTVRETDASISKTLRMDYDTFTNASFILQGKADQFAQQKPSDRKKILSSILGLEIWETYKENAAEKRKINEVEVSGLDRILDEIEQELNEEDERLLHLKQVEENLFQASALRKGKETLVENVRKQYQSLKEQESIKSMLAKQVSKGEKRLQDLQSQFQNSRQEQMSSEEKIASAAQIESAYKRWLQSRNDLDSWEQLAEKFRHYEKKKNQPILVIEREASSLEQEQRSLSYRQAQVTSMESSRLQSGKYFGDLQGEIDQARNSIKEKPYFEGEIRRTQEERSGLMAENRQLKLEMDSLKERMDRLEGSTSADCPLCGQELPPPDRQALLESLKKQGTEKAMQYRQNQEKIAGMGVEISHSENKLKELQQLDQETQKKQRILDQLLEEIRQKDLQAQEWQQNGFLRLKEVEHILEQQLFAEDARRELVEIEDTLNRIGYDPSRHEAARQAEQEGHASQDKYRELENARAALAPLKREIENLQIQLNEEETTLAESRETYRAALEKIELDRSDLPDLQIEESELVNLQEKENRLRMELGGARQRVNVLKDLRKRKKEKQAERENIRWLVSQYKTLERAFGKDGVPALLIEQALPEIEAQASEILSRLTSGRMGIRFATQKEYKDRKRDDKRETLEIHISDTSGVREYELFSGGEAFRVNFAIRLALSRVLAQRAGSRLQTLVIDEGFGSQDAEGLQRLIEAINIVRADFSKVLVISHLEEMKDTFPARIEVEKTHHGSSLRVVS